MLDRGLHTGTGYAGRLPWIDIAKALAAWMVVTSHLLRRGILTDVLAAVSVSVFFVLAGVTQHHHADLRQFLLRLVRRVIIPYVLVGLCSIVIYRILGRFAAERLGAESGNTTLLLDLSHLLYGSSVHGQMKWNESLWFLPCYCVMILLSEILARIARQQWLLTTILHIAGGTAGYLLIAHGMIGLPWHLETALLVLPLCAAGHLVRRCSATNSIALRRLAGIIGLACFVIGMMIFPAAEESAGGSLSLRAVYLAGPGLTYGFLMLTSVGMVIFVDYIGQEWRAPILQMIGERSLTIVLWNKFPVLCLQVLLPLVLPGVQTLFVGGEHMSNLFIAALLALPCMFACLLWEYFYRKAGNSLFQILF